MSGHRKTNTTLFNKSWLTSSAEKGTDTLLIMHEMCLLSRPVFVQGEKSWKTTFCPCHIIDKNEQRLFHAMFLCSKQSYYLLYFHISKQEKVFKLLFSHGILLRGYTHKLLVQIKSSAGCLVICHCSWVPCQGTGNGLY